MPRTPRSVPFPLVAKECAYSPCNVNPVEEAFSKIEALVRGAEARSRGPLVEAAGRALSAVTARDARGFFEHCGHAVVGRPS